MPGPNQNESTWSRAQSDTTRVYGSTAFQVGSGLVTTGATAGLVIALAGSGEPTQTQIAVPILAGVVSLMLCFGTIFLVQLAAAPIRQRNEARSQLDPGLTKTVDPRLELRNEIRKGDDLARAVRRKRGYTQADSETAEEWTNRVAEILAHHGTEAEAVKFVEASKGSDKALAGELEARLAVLDEICGDRDSPLSLG